MIEHAPPQSDSSFDALGRATAQAAVRALLCEVAATPKPGLVDRANTGAHRDMDFMTFMNSAAALWPYFYAVTLAGARHEGPLQTLLPALRPAGLQAEAAMYTATGGVNTHKGLIFSLGVLCAAHGWQCAGGRAGTAEALLDAAAQVCCEVCGELERPAGEDATTKGRAAWAGHRVRGIRGEMAAGLPAVRETGYPAFLEAVRRNQSLNDAGVAALLHMMTVVDDTNVIGRAGIGALHALQANVRAALARCADDGARLLRCSAALDEQLIQQSISPGGSADLLAICYFLYFVFEEDGAA